MNSSSPETVIASKATTFFRLFCSGRFTVPWHQRRYDWQPEHVDELLHDFADAIEANRPCYFLGTIILVESAPGRWNINDGQQRMVTLSLICACLLRMFTDHNDSHRAYMALRVLFDIDENSTDALEKTDQLSPRMTPPRDDKTRYNLMIRGRSIGANGKLTLAWRQIDTFVAGMGLEKSKRFFDFLMQKVEVACLDIPTYVDPNSVYETINCRGKRLDDLDLIRNHLYSYFSAAGDARCDLVHENLESIRTQLRDDKKYAEYARCYFQSRYGFLRKSNFYREARRQVQIQVDRADSGSGYVYELVHDFALRENVELFRIISTPSQGNHFVEEFDRLSGHSDSKRNLSMFLRELHAYKVTQPLLFALLSRYITETDGRRRRRLGKWIHTRLKHVTSFVMRTAFVAPKFEPSHFESEFSDLAAQIVSASKSGIYDVRVDTCLKDCDIAHGVIDDKKFKMKMSEIEMRDTKKIKRFLFGVNCSIQSDADLMSEIRCTIEHILPKASRHWASWHDFGDNPGEWVHRIGNLTLLGRHDNKPGDMDNRDFIGKRDIYSNSAVQISRHVGSYERWGPKEIVKRQKWLAKKAANVWSFEPSMVVTNPTS